MQCTVCRTPLAAHMRFCPLCATPVTPAPGSAPADPLRKLLERTLRDQFEVIRPLGRGGMGVVYLARERGLERLVAIKVLLPEVSATEESRERFRREARTAARLTHPNILPLYAFGEVGELAYLVMGYVRGESLADRLKQDGKIQPGTARQILAELADALDYAHRHGVVHRDIKPENVLIDDESGRALLTDFGIAKGRAVSGTLTRTGAVVGTPHYMSPEQAAGDREIDGRSDIYSLGVLGYTMLAGRLPIQGASLREIFVKHMTHEPAPLDTLVPDVPDDLAAAITRCLAKTPEARWSDGKSLRRALTRDDQGETRLPEDLRGLPGFAAWAALWAAVWGSLAASDGAAGRDAALLLFIAVLVPVGFLLEVWVARRRGFRLRPILRVGCWPPTWWGLWWPRGLRRPGDVWDCLPTSAKLTRVSVSAFFVAVPLLALAARRAPLESARHLGTWRVDDPLVAAQYGLLVLTVAVVLGAALLWSKRGLTLEDVTSLILGPTVRPGFWSRSHIAVHVAPRRPRGVACAPTQPVTAHDCLRSISEAAESLAGPARALGSEAINAARQLLASIQALDAEIATLGRDGDPSEATRIEQKLAALSGAEPDADEQQMRVLLKSQLELVRRLGSRLEVAAERRAQLIDMMKTLWLQIANLRAQTAEESLEGREVTDRIHRLCAAIGERADQEVPTTADSPVIESSPAARGPLLGDQSKVPAAR
jgi:predicted Ser/Thr protein kinase